ncbi:hypothetical protein GEMRC1_007100 [Eukaryota sp. GEM-RC1]
MESQEGRGPIDSLIEKNADGYIFRVKSDAENRLEALFIVNREVLPIARRFRYVFCLDSTYKTNTFGMPMFHVVGFTCLNSSFSAACVFMAKETEEYYLWTLEQFKDVFNIIPGVFLTDKEKALINAVRKVFPTSGHVLCLFHIVQNLIQIKNAKGISDPAWKIFMEHFYSLIQSEAVEEFCWNLDVMTGKYENDRECGDAFIYLINNWFDMKESFCYYNIDQFTHFKTYTNNRAESAHNTLKSGDRMYKRDLESAMENVMATMEHQVIDLRRNIDVDKQRVDRELIKTPLYL